LRRLQLGEIQEERHEDFKRREFESAVRALSRTSDDVIAKQLLHKVDQTFGDLYTRGIGENGTIPIVDVRNRIYNPYRVQAPSNPQLKLLFQKVDQYLQKSKPTPRVDTDDIDGLTGRADFDDGVLTPEQIRELVPETPIVYSPAPPPILNPPSISPPDMTEVFQSAIQAALSHREPPAHPALSDLGLGDPNGVADGLAQFVRENDLLDLVGSRHRPQEEAHIIFTRTDPNAELHRFREQRKTSAVETNLQHAKGALPPPPSAPLRAQNGKPLSPAIVSAPAF